MPHHPREGGAIAKSHGIVIGSIQKLSTGLRSIPKHTIEPHKVAHEKKRLHRAVTAALNELEVESQYLRQLHQQEPMLILDSHRMLLSDPAFIDYPQSLIQQDLINAEWALKRQLCHVIATFDGMKDSYLRSKRIDIEQVGERLMRQLMGLTFTPDIHTQPKSTVLVGYDLAPADMVSMWRSGVAGVICEQGSLNSHAIIIARSIGFPALMGVDIPLQHLCNGQTIILDAERGYWKLDPDADEQRAYQHFIDALNYTHSGLLQLASQPSHSAEGIALPIQANIEFKDELPLVQQMGAEGVGLFRSEFMFMQHNKEPSEEEQYQQYHQIVQNMQGQPITFRLLDIGGDKPVLFQQLTGHNYQAANPALGLRGVRLLLQSPDMLTRQLRALLRASQHGPIKILVPMVTRAEEMVQVRALMHACCASLQDVQAVPLGCMVEVPAAVMIADELAEVSDFFSIGTNDLTQYTFAADRADEEVAHCYQEGHPAILTMIRQTVLAAQHANIPVSVCGELAANPRFTQAFLDMGMDALSMSLHSILPIRRHLSRLNKKSHLH